jgi:hypothetical protein
MVAGAALALLLAGTVARADSSPPTMADYFAAKKEHSYRWVGDQIWLSGFANGYSAASMASKVAGRKEFYCAPVTLYFDNLTDILEREYADPADHWTPDSTIRTVFLVALERTFPCRGPQ